MYASKISIIGLFISVLLLTSCNKQDEIASASVPPSVDVISVILKDTKDWDMYNGRVEATDNVSILPRVSGYITKVAYHAGSEIKQGDLLFIIDQRPYKVALESEVAHLNQAKASLIYLKQQYERSQKLIKTEAISRDDLEHKRADYEQGIAAVRAAESAVDAASLNLAFTEIRSPISGKASKAQLTVGNLAIADQSILTSVVKQDPVYVYFDPDEKKLLEYKRRLAISTNSSVRIGLSIGKEFPYEGKLNFIDNQVNPSTGTIMARATVSNSERLFTPGMFARVELSVGESVPRILIPERAILTDQDKKYVYVVVKNNKVEKRYVKLGRIVAQGQIVNRGIENGDRVVVSGLQQIYASGMTVSPNLINAK